MEGKVRRFDRVKVSFQDTDGKTISKIYK
ncbi:hypothetical protein KBB05_00405 [Patescibacteria group bacterium]|nr:hypothetical protein [Patescibacteria group bacterium]